MIEFRRLGQSAPRNAQSLRRHGSSTAESARRNGHQRFSGQKFNRVLNSKPIVLRQPSRQRDGQSAKMFVPNLPLCTLRMLIRDYRSVTLRFGSLSLSRVAPRAAPLPFRSFSTSHPCLKPAITRKELRKNPELKKQTAPKPTYTAATDLSAEGEQPPVNTEAPLTSRDPAPDNAPASSAEVPPNAEMPPPPPSMQKKKEATMEELMASISGKPDAEAEATPKPQGSPHAYNATSTRAIDLSKIVGNSADRYQAANSDPRVHDPTAQPTVRTAPVTGRTIFVDPENPVRGKVQSPEQGFKRLDVIMNQNRIKTMWHQQRFSERPGMKRKRLKMQRWKRRFRYGFIEATRRVKELKRQGW